MFKRIIIGIISVVMAATMLTGCTFFERNTERDYKQVVAEIKSYDIQNEVTTETVDEQTGETVTSIVPVTYKTQKRTIYKRDLIEYVSNNQSSLASSYSNMKDLVRAAMEMLIDTELIVNEVDALIDAGLVEWGQAQQNTIRQRIYQVIDGSLISLQNDLLEGRDKPTIDNNLESLNENTTYPVKPEETVDDDEDDDAPVEPWAPSLSSYPGLFGDNDERSLGRQSLRDFILLLRNRVKDDFRVTAEDKKKFKEDDKLIDEVEDTKGIQYVYEILGDTHYMYYISGKNIERSVKIAALQSYLTDSIKVEDSEVEDRYAQLLNGQKTTFDSNISLYESAMSGNDPVLYYPNNDYFYVKHILLPFSDAQTAALTAYKASHTDEEIETYRKNLVSNIVCYPHVAGEDDKTQPMTVAEVVNEIRATMLPLEGNAKLADNAFDDLIYKYNTDPGAFGNAKGYLVKNSETGNNYMQEFTDAALDMYKTLEVGQVYDEWVITDYGVHIMYLASATTAGRIAGLHDYTTTGEQETYYDVIEQAIYSAKEQVMYQAWENVVLANNYKTKAKYYEDRYSDLWDN